MLNDGQDRCEVCGVLDGKDVRLDMCDGCKISLFCSGKYKFIEVYLRGWSLYYRTPFIWGLMFNL